MTGGESVRAAFPAEPAQEAGRAARTRETVRWWQWPNVLSLDAPVVALVWLWALDESLGTPATPGIFAALGLTVWCIYTADRLLDAARLLARRQAGDMGVLEAAGLRHRFASRHWRMLAAALALGALALAAFVLLALPLSVIGNGLAAAVLVLAYFGCFVRPQRKRGRELPLKEVSCGLIFALGVAIGCAGIREAPSQAWPLVLLLGGLCSLNCLAIACWEKDADARCGAVAITRRFPGVQRYLGGLAIGLALASLAAGWALGHVEFGLSIGAAALLLLGLDAWRHRLSIEFRRVVADAVLLTPLVIYPFVVR